MNTTTVTHPLHTNLSAQITSNSDPEYPCAVHRFDGTKHMGSVPFVTEAAAVKWLQDLGFVMPATTVEYVIYFDANGYTANGLTPDDTKVTDGYWGTFQTLDDVAEQCKLLWSDVYTTKVSVTMVVHS